MSNCNPISLLHQLSKILEYIFGERSSKFTSSNAILSNSQCGFRETSRHLMLCKMVLTYLDGLLTQTTHYGHFIDLIDTIDHNIGKLDFLIYVMCQATSI